MDAVENVIIGYTREPGVRELERNIGRSIFKRKGLFVVTMQLNI